MLSPRAPPLRRSGAAAGKLYSHPQTHAGLLIVSSWVKFLPKVPRSVPTPALYTVPSQLRKFVHNLLGSRSQIRNCPGHLDSVLTWKYGWDFMSLLCYTPDWRGFMGAFLPGTPSPSRAERQELPAGKEEVCQGGGSPLPAVQRNCEVVCLWTQPSSLYSPWQLPTLEHTALHGVTVNYATLQLNNDE